MQHPRRKFWNLIRFAVLGTACLALQSCVTLPTIALTVGAAALKVASPVARKEDEKWLIGARVGSVGGGVWAGSVEPIFTETERERLNRLEATINDMMIKSALSAAPAK